MKYKTTDQIVAALLEGGRIKSFQDLKYKYTNTKPEYSKLIQDGVDVYKAYLASKVVETAFGKKL